MAVLFAWLGTRGQRKQVITRAKLSYPEDPRVLKWIEWQEEILGETVSVPPTREDWEAWQTECLLREANNPVSNLV